MYFDWYKIGRNIECKWGVGIWTSFAGFYGLFAFLQFILEFSDFVRVIGLQDLDVVSRLLFHFFKTQFWVVDNV